MYKDRTDDKIFELVRKGFSPETKVSSSFRIRSFVLVPALHLLHCSLILPSACSPSIHFPHFISLQWLFTIFRFVLLAMLGWVWRALPQGDRDHGVGQGSHHQAPQQRHGGTLQSHGGFARANELPSVAIEVSSVHILRFVR